MAWARRPRARKHRGGGVVDGSCPPARFRSMKKKRVRRNPVANALSSDPFSPAHGEAG